MNTKRGKCLILPRRLPACAMAFLATLGASAAMSLATAAPARAQEKSGSLKRWAVTGEAGVLTLPASSFRYLAYSLGGRVKLHELFSLGLRVTLNHPYEIAGYRQWVSMTTATAYFTPRPVGGVLRYHLGAGFGVAYDRVNNQGGAVPGPTAVAETWIGPERWGAVIRGEMLLGIYDFDEASLGIFWPFWGLSGGVYVAF